MELKTVEDLTSASSAENSLKSRQQMGMRVLRPKSQRNRHAIISLNFEKKDMEKLFNKHMILMRGNRLCKIVPFGS